MPPATFLMILLPSVHTLSFLLIGLGVMGLAFLSYICQKRIQKN
ncbi:FMN adenylyltransferase [Streptococcus constellatus subsp. constellatus]|nr:FMN adenylyltransferase [Streptococcus constellatus subsp. constellatus]